MDALQNTPSLVKGSLGIQHTTKGGRVWACNTHTPFTLKDTTTFAADKCVSIVRNPVDTVVACLYHSQLESSSLKPREEFNTVHPEFWEQWIDETSQQMASHHDLMAGSVAKKIPTFIIRYEDLLFETISTLTELFCFLLDVDSLEGTVVLERIREAAKESNHMELVYKLKQ